MTGKYDVYYENEICGELEISEDGLHTVLSCRCDIVSDDVLRLFCISGEKTVSIGVCAPEDGKLRLRRSLSKNAMREMGLGEIAGAALACSAKELQPEQPSRHFQTEPPKPETDGTEPADEEQPEPPKSEVPNLEPTDEKRPEPQEKSPMIDPPVAREETDLQKPDAAASETDVDGAFSGWRPESEPHLLFRDADIAEACRNLKGALVSERGGATLLAVPCGGDEPFPMMPVFCFGEPKTINGMHYIVFGIESGEIIT